MTDQKNTNNAAKFAFFYMLSLVALVFLSVATGMIIFQVINKYIVDVAGRFTDRYSDEGIKFGISALVISTPIFYFITARIYKSLFSGELSKDSGIRKWLTYFILFVSSVVMIGWAIAIINNFLDGELTMRFILKALTVLVISVGVFVFYFYDIKRKEVFEKKDNVVRAYFIASLVIVFVVFVTALFTIESPAETRKKRLDNEIINSFYSIDNCVQEYVSRTGELPDSLKEAEDNCVNIIENGMADKETGKEFEYKIAGEMKYKLCAEFRTSNMEKDDSECVGCSYPTYVKEKKMLHDVGWQCIEREATRRKEAENPLAIPVRIK